MKDNRPVYLDCNATTPIDPRVHEVVGRFMAIEFGNAGSRTHVYGSRAKQVVQKARRQVALVVAAEPDEVIFTSGATESNNLSILGLAPYGEQAGKKHIISTEIEHKAVLEPLAHLASRGFDVTLLPPTSGGWIDPQTLRDALRPDTLLVSIMHVNNETGVCQPLDEIAQLLSDHPAFFHTDAAQGFGKDVPPLRNPRIDLISISGHKIYAPKGIGALVTRRRDFKRPPLEPLMYGGGQERALRPGTLPVHLAVGLGKAAELALEEADSRAIACGEFRDRLLAALLPLGPIIHGSPDRTLPHVVNLSFSGLDSEAVMVALKDLVAISNGSACTSTDYEASHVLKAMALNDADIESATRWSWYHATDGPDWRNVVRMIQSLR